MTGTDLVYLPATAARPYPGEPNTKLQNKQSAINYQSVASGYGYISQSSWLALAFVQHMSHVSANEGLRSHGGYG